jgi:hypothetical protein
MKEGYKFEGSQALRTHVNVVEHSETVSMHSLGRHGLCMLFLAAFHFLLLTSVNCN